MTAPKSYSCLCDRMHECIILIMSNQFVIQMYLYLKCGVKKKPEIQNYKL
jgi:hypothetical protein